MKAATWMLTLSMALAGSALSVRAADDKPQAKSDQPKQVAPREGNPPRKAEGTTGRDVLADVEQLVIDYQAQQRARLEEYRRIAAQARDATAQKREQLREQLRRIIEQQTLHRERLREQIRERVKELEVDLQSRKEVIDAAKETAREKKDRARGE